MTLTTRRFVLRHVIDNSSKQKTVQSEYHLGYRWTTKVEVSNPEWQSQKEISTEFYLPGAELVGKHKDSEIWIRTLFIDKDGMITYKRKRPEIYDVMPNNFFKDDDDESEDKNDNENEEYLYDEEDDNEGSMGPGSLCLSDDFKKAKIGLINENDVVTMELQIKVIGEFPEKNNPSDFSKASELTDGVLVAGKTKFNVNRAILALQSFYFHDLFYEQGRSEIELMDLSSETLQDLLEVIYHSSNISESNLRPLLEAARTYRIKLVTKQCKQFLITNDKMDLNKKKWVAAKFRLGDLTEDLRNTRDRLDFSKANSGLTNVVLVVQDEKFHVNKAILATFSSYFITMFFGRFRETEQSEIELKGIDPETFQSLLEIIYHCPNVHEKNVKNLLELARMYDVQPATSHCEKFLMVENTLEKLGKINLAKEYGLIDLIAFLEDQVTEPDATEPVAKKQRTD